MSSRNRSGSTEETEDNLVPIQDHSWAQETLGGLSLGFLLLGRPGLGAGVSWVTEVYSSTWPALDNLTLSFPRLSCHGEGAQGQDDRGQQLWSTGLCWVLTAFYSGPAPPTKDFRGASLNF